MRPTGRFFRILVVLPVVFCLALPSPGYSAESYVLKYVKKWTSKLFPKMEEVGWIVDFWAVLEQVGALARETLTLVHQYQESYENLVKVKESIENAWKDVETLYKNFDPYDMDNWARTLQGAQYVINYDCGGAIRAWAAEDFVGATQRYLFNVDSIFNYDYRKQKNKEFVNEYYFNKDLEKHRLEYANVFGVYAGITFDLIQQQLDTLDRDVNGELADSLENILRTYSDRLVNVAINHEDTLINLIRDMVVHNLTGVQTIEGMINDFEQSADFFVEEFYMLKDGVGTSKVADSRDGADNTRNKMQSAYSKSIEAENKVWDENNANSVPPPPKTTRGEDANNGTGQNAYKTSHTLTFPWKRKVSEHDIAHFQNAVDFTLIQQDMALRDISVMNAQAIAVLLAAKAYDDNKIETLRLMIRNQSLEGKQ